MDAHPVASVAILLVKSFMLCLFWKWNRWEDSALKLWHFRELCWFLHSLELQQSGECGLRLKWLKRQTLMAYVQHMYGICTLVYLGIPWYTLVYLGIPWVLGSSRRLLLPRTGPMVVFSGRRLGRCHVTCYVVSTFWRHTVMSLIQCISSWKIHMYVAVTWHFYQTFIYIHDMCFKVHQGIFCAGDFYVASPFVAGSDCGEKTGSRPATGSDQSLSSSIGFHHLNPSSS